MKAITSPAHLSSVLRDPAKGVDAEIVLILRLISEACIELSSRMRAGASVAGEDIEQPIDIFASDVFLAALGSGPVGAVLPKAAEGPTVLDASASFAVVIDPLEGSGMSANGPMGTSFSVVRVRSSADPATTFLQSGRQICAAGIVMYGPATVLALSVGHGTDLFVLDPGGDFIRTHSNVAIPTGTREFAINAANYRHWDPLLRIYIDDLVAGADGPRGEDFDMHWMGSAVADAYRTLLHGGISLYPFDARDGDSRQPVRLLYGAQPIAFLVEQAGGAAIDMTGAVLDRVPSRFNACCPLVFGSRDKVERVAEYLTAPQFTGERSPLFAPRGLFRS